MHRRRTITTTATAAALALLAPLTAAAAAPAPDGPEATSPDSLARGDIAGEDIVRQELLQAAQHASGEVARGAAVNPRSPEAPPRTTRVFPIRFLPQLDAAMGTVVDDGAIGVNARIETPTTDWKGSAGSRTLDGDAAVRTQDRFRGASTTKMMIATLVMQEVQAGTWTLDTRVEDILPGLFPDHPDVTLEHLLSHTSGMPTGTDLSLLTRITDPTSWEEFIDALGQDYTDEEHLAVVNAVPWAHEPGEGFTYSNAGYIALGVLLEEVTGSSVADLLVERVFTPAEMRDTRYPDDPGFSGPTMREALYTDGGQWWTLDGFDPEVFSHAGAAVTTTEDLNDLTAALVTGELVDPALVEDMLEPRSTEILEYGLGIYRVPDPCAPQEYLYGHDGGSFGTVSLALTSADGTRQVSLGVTGRNLSSDPEALYDLSDLLVPLLLSSC